MTSKERMMVALEGGKPDRLPVTIHQWQDYELRNYLGGLDQLDAYLACGLDASVCVYDVLRLKESPDWVISKADLGEKDGERFERTTVQTPEGELTWVTASNEYTTFRTEFPVKNERDASVFARYYPGMTVDRDRLRWWYDRTGDAGIVRGFFSFFGQAGPWQDFCEMVGTEEAIFWAMDNPQFVHHILDELTEQKERHIHEEMPGLPYDLIECGGGAGSSTVISPSLFEEFCVPYDRRLNEALRAAGHKSVYHTCGGMMSILDKIPLNGTDASETLSPPGVGGDIRKEDRARVKEVLGSKVSLIGGIDQLRLLEQGTPEEIEADVRHCFETFGANGGYICSASDHFFNAPIENLKALAAAGRDCTY